MEGVTEVGYFGRLRQFSRNARLYLLHVIGMDLIHGAWEVLFNLYLLAVGFDVRFVGIRIAVLGIAGALASIPAGRLADRIDRNAIVVCLVTGSGFKDEASVDRMLDGVECPTLTLDELS